MSSEMRSVDPQAVSEAVASVRRELHELSADDVRIVAVTKSFGADAIEAAARAGCQAIGENYAQELLEKKEAIPPGMEVHFIGHVQTNKVRSLVGVVDVWQTVDRASLVDELAKRSPGARILLQVNTTGEATKSGCSFEELDELVERATRAQLQPLGLMTIGPTGGSETQCAQAFAALRRHADRLGLRECSMGMSEDWRIAVREGSTMIRLGSALFGARTPRAPAD